VLHFLKKYILTLYIYIYIYIYIYNPFTGYNRVYINAKTTFKSGWPIIGYWLVANNQLVAGYIRSNLHP
jgi:hypothetical protein